MRYESILEIKDPINIERKISTSNNSGTNKALVESVKTLNDTKSRGSTKNEQEAFSHLPPMQAALAYDDY